MTDHDPGFSWLDLVRPSDFSNMAEVFNTEHIEDTAEQSLHEVGAIANNKDMSQLHSSDSYLTH